MQKMMDAVENDLVVVILQRSEGRRFRNSGVSGQSLRERAVYRARRRHYIRIRGEISYCFGNVALALLEPFPTANSKKQFFKLYISKCVLYFEYLSNN